MLADGQSIQRLHVIVIDAFAKYFSLYPELEMPTS